MKFVIILVLLVGFIQKSHSQVITWEKQFHFDKYTSDGLSIETEDSGFIVFPGVDNDSTNSLWMIKLNKFGTMLWKKILPQNLYIISIARIGYNRYLSLDNENKYDTATKLWVGSYHLTELNSDGDTSFSSIFNVNHKIYFPTQILPLNNGSFIINADYSNKDSTIDLLVQRFSKNQTLVWSDTFNHGSGTDNGIMIKTRDNRIVIGANGGAGGTHDKFAFLLVLDTNGKQLNYVQYPYIYDKSEQIEHIQQLKNGNFMVESDEWGYNPVYYTLADSTGNTIKRWSLDYLPNGTGGLISDGDSIIVYADMSLITGPLVLIKFDTAFKTLWTKFYDNTSYFYNVADQVIRTMDGGVLFTATRSTTPSSDMVIIKVNTNGYCANENLAGINNTFQNTDISIYPNPATNNLYISTQNVNTTLKLDVFDSRGAIIKSMQELSPGIENIDVSNLSKGLYMYRLYNNAGVYSTGKFVKE